MPETDQRPAPSREDYAVLHAAAREAFSEIFGSHNRSVPMAELTRRHDEDPRVIALRDYVASHAFPKPSIGWPGTPGRAMATTNDEPADPYS